MRKREKKEVQALTSFDVTIDKPIIYGLVGPNGAGKTTFIKHCLGLVEGSTGSIEELKKESNHEGYIKTLIEELNKEDKKNA